MNDSIVFRNRLIFVMGMQRSGTTALLEALGQDPSLQMENERESGDFWDQFYLKPEPEIRPLLCRCKRRLLMKPIVEVRRRMLDDLLNEFADYEPVIAWIYRDPVDVWSSALLKFDWSDDDFRRWIDEWCTGNWRALELKKSALGDKIGIVSYRDLIERRDVFDRLCEFLNVEPRNNLFWREDQRKGRKRLPPDLQQKIEERTAKVMRELDSVRLRPRSTARRLFDDPRVGPECLVDFDLLCQSQRSASLQVIDQGIVRVEMDPSDESSPMSVQLSRTPLTTVGGERYTLGVWIRSAAPAPASILVSQNHEPWDSLGGCIEMDLTTDWQYFSQTFTASKTDLNARVHLDLGSAGPWVELSEPLLRSPGFHRYCLEARDGASARCAPAAGDIAGIRVEVQNPGPERHSLQLHLGSIKIDKNADYSAVITARSDEPRIIAFCVGRDGEPWEELGLYSLLHLDAGWRTFQFDFKAIDDAQARLFVDLGHEGGSVEVSGAQLRLADSRRLTLESKNGADGRLQYLTEPTGAIRAEPILSDEAVAADLQVIAVETEVEAGLRYQIDFNARADRGRDFMINVVLRPGWTGVGFYQKIHLSRTWRPFHFEFVAKRSGRATLVFELGDDDAPVEIDAPTFQSAVQDLTDAEIGQIQRIVEGARGVSAAMKSRSSKHS